MGIRQWERGMMSPIRDWSVWNAHLRTYKPVVGSGMAVRAGEVAESWGDNVKPLGVEQVQWFVGDCYIPDWVKDQPNLSNGKSWQRTSEATMGGSCL